MLRCGFGGTSSPEFSVSPEECLHAVNAFRVSVYTFRTPCVCLQRSVLAHFSVSNRRRNDRQADFLCSANPQRGESYWASRHRPLPGTPFVATRALRRFTPIVIDWRKIADCGSKSVTAHGNVAANLPVPSRLLPDDPATESLISLIQTSCDVALKRVAGVATPLMSSHSASTTWDTRAGSHW